jgi:Ribonuclease G/E
MSVQDILINWAPQETRVAVVENGAVQELHIERTLERGLVGNVYLGKVVRVLPGMQSAFIDIGLERAAFLHVADLNPGPKTDAPLVPIERQVFEGQTLTVQVIKDAIGTKGARLSSQVSIAGRMLVFLPHDNHIGISQKIGSAELRESLRARVTALAHAPAKDSRDGKEGTGGFILRTNAEEASEHSNSRRDNKHRYGAAPRLAAPGPGGRETVEPPPAPRRKEKGQKGEEGKKGEERRKDGEGRREGCMTENGEGGLHDIKGRREG